MRSSSIPKDSLAGAVVSFGRLLKENGFTVSTPSVMDALRGVSRVGVENLHDFQTVLRATFTVRREESAMFDRLFTAFWMAGEILEESREDQAPRPGPESGDLDSSLGLTGSRWLRQAYPIPRSKMPGMQDLMRFIRPMRSFGSKTSKRSR